MRNITNRKLNKTSLKVLSVATAASLGLLAIPAFAAPKADLNQDGQITQAEFSADAQSRFTQADANFDGMLDKTELRTLGDIRRAERQSQVFQAMDMNGDGSVTEAEMQASAAARDAKKSERREAMKAKILERLDTNSDGTVSDAEKQAAKDARKAKRKEQRAERSENGERKKMNRKRGNRIQLDANKDGLVSLAEYTASSDALFLRMDANGDGILTKGEGRKKGKRRRHGDRKGKTQR